MLFFLFHSFFLLGHEVTTRPTNCNVEKATNFVLNPGSGSELCVLSEDSVTEGGIRPRNNTRDNDDLPVNPTRKNLHVKEPV